MRRSMNVLEGFGTLDPLSQFDHSPFFGQLFVASVYLFEAITIGHCRIYNLKIFELVLPLSLLSLIM